MDIKRSGSQPSGQGPSEWFTGMVRIDPLHSAPDPARVAMASVTFEPGARTAWHTHQLGQTLIITFWRGWVQREGGLVEEIVPGDVVWFEPNEKHWHGATATTAMTHIATQERLDGEAVTWMEQVTEDSMQGRELQRSGALSVVQSRERTVSNPPATVVDQLLRMSASEHLHRPAERQ